MAGRNDRHIRTCCWIDPANDFFVVQRNHHMPARRGFVFRCGIIKARFPRPRFGCDANPIFRVWTAGDPNRKGYIGNFVFGAGIGGFGRFWPIFVVIRGHFCPFPGGTAKSPRRNCWFLMICRKIGGWRYEQLHKIRAIVSTIPPILALEQHGSEREPTYQRDTMKRKRMACCLVSISESPQNFHQFHQHFQCLHLACGRVRRF